MEKLTLCAEDRRFRLQKADTVLLSIYDGVTGLWHGVVCFFGVYLLFYDDITLKPSGKVSCRWEQGLLYKLTRSSKKYNQITKVGDSFI